MFELGEKGWSWGCSSQIDLAGRVLFTADAHRDNGKRFMVSADEKLTSFLELERVICDDSDSNAQRNAFRLRGVRLQRRLKQARLTSGQVLLYVHSVHIKPAAGGSLRVSVAMF
jgi:hypothetical protein